MRQTDVRHFAHLTSRPEPVYRLAEKEWKDFVESFTDVLIEADSQIPYLPPKDVIHRVYRDVRHYTFLMLSPLIPLLQVRFSNDKTPYKTNFSATFSRGGRKGIFACCKHIIQRDSAQG